MPRLRTLASLGAAAACLVLVWDCAASETRCAGLSREEAVAMAIDARRSMLARSTPRYRAGHSSERVVSVALHPSANGYSARVEFPGPGGGSLVALIAPDCHIGWTGRGPAA